MTIIMVMGDGRCQSGREGNAFATGSPARGPEAAREGMGQPGRGDGYGGAVPGPASGPGMRDLAMAGVSRSCSGSSAGGSM